MYICINCGKGYERESDKPLIVTMFDQVALGCCCSDCKGEIEEKIQVKQKYGRH